MCVFLSTWHFFLRGGLKYRYFELRYHESVYWHARCFLCAQCRNGSTRSSSTSSRAPRSGRVTPRSTSRPGPFFTEVHQKLYMYCRPGTRIWRRLIFVFIFWLVAFFLEFSPKTSQNTLQCRSLASRQGGVPLSRETFIILWRREDSIGRAIFLVGLSIINFHHFSGGWREIGRGPTCPPSRAILFDRRNLDPSFRVGSWVR